MLRKFQDRFKNHGKIRFCKVKKISLSRKGRGKPRRTEGEKNATGARRGFASYGSWNMKKWATEAHEVVRPVPWIRYFLDHLMIPRYPCLFSAIARSALKPPSQFFSSRFLYFQNNLIVQTQIYNSRNDRFNCSFIHCSSRSEDQ